MLVNCWEYITPETEFILIILYNVVPLKALTPDKRKVPVC